MPEACDNTLWIAERADVELEFGQPVLPAFPVPEGHTEDTYLRELTFEGAKERYGPSPAHRRARADRVRARRHRVDGVLRVLPRRVGHRALRTPSAASGSGPGRGSAAGSCVAFCLRIVDIDPIKYDLLFERFLNPGRKQMPDIDMDFDSRYRGEMIKYVAQKYGADHVAQIVTFSTIKARAAVRDAARVLDYPYGLGDKIAKLMPPLDHGPRHPAARVPRGGPEVRGRLQDGRRAAGALRGRSRRASGSSTSPRASRACAARTASTPPRS